jgi:DNA repair protein RecO (recombination protein O)
MFRLPVEKLAGEPWPRARGADLRKFLMQILARHLERTPITVAQLEKLD